MPACQDNGSLKGILRVPEGGKIKMANVLIDTSQFFSYFYKTQEIDSSYRCLKLPLMEYLNVLHMVFIESNRHLNSFIVVVVSLDTNRYIEVSIV